MTRYKKNKLLRPTTYPSVLSSGSKDKLPTKNGFTLLDSLIGILLFVLIGIAIYQAYFSLTNLIVRSTAKAAAASILTEQLEIIRNLAYADVGLIDGLPSGVLPQDRAVVRNGKNFNVHLIVRNVDDDFDGTIGGSSSDVTLTYAAHIGDGGLTMANSSAIIGSVFSNGPITGSNSASVSNDLWSAGANIIDGITVGGDAHANTIEGSAVTDDAYYQTITNTTVGGNSYPGSPDPSVQNLPITQAQIDAWKNEAAAGGEMGGYILTGSNTDSLGPIKINGDLTLTNKAILTLTGAIWVTGDVTLRNSSAIDLDSSYSSSSGILIADGKIDIDNTVAGCGSEGFNVLTKICNTFSGSYLILLSTNNSVDTTSPAILMNNSTEFKGILYANNGLVFVKNSAEVVEVTGYAVRVENGAKITFGTGLYTIQITGNPNTGDLSPADYKLIDITISCSNCGGLSDLKVSTYVAPKGLETSIGNGALFVQVFNAAGQPVPQANVQVVNNALLPIVSFNDITDSSGWLRLVDVPPALESYEITVTKVGYSQDQTYPPGEPANPSPIKPHATVVADAVTQASFSIDQVSQLNFSSLNNICKAVPNVAFSLTGSRLIGTDPDIIKYTNNHSTDGAGALSISAMEWDTYSLQLNDPLYYLAGSLPPLPLALSPGTQQSITLSTALKTANAVLIEVQDAVTQLPIEQASINLTGPGYDNFLETGEGHWQQTDWSGGSGQETFGDLSRFFDFSGSLDISNPAGELKLQDLGGTYPPSGWLISSSFDNSTSTNYYHLTVRPQDQPAQTGTDPIRIRIASNDDNATWNWLGPDGTNGTYYTLTDRTLHSAHSNDRYIRYKMELYTDDTNFTPNVSDVAISFASSCTPSGQAYFNDVGTGNYSLTITKEGYQVYNDTPTLVSGWQYIIVNLDPL